MSRFLDLTERGHSEWWRYVLGLVFIVAFWLFLSGLILGVAFALVAMDGNPNTIVDGTTIQGVPPLVNFLLPVSTFLALWLALWLVVRFGHGRSLHSFITPDQSIRWRRFGQAILVYMALIGVVSLVESTLYPGRYQWTFDPARFFPFLAAGLIFIPIQTLAEELLFRGYLLQASSKLTRNWLVLCLLNGVVFTLFHLSNPEVAISPWLLALYFLAFGAFASFITLKDEGLELVMGMHTGNNLFTFTIANYTVTALESPSLFTIRLLDPVYNLAAPLLAMVVFYWFFFVWRKSGTEIPQQELRS